CCRLRCRAGRLRACAPGAAERCSGASPGCRRCRRWTAAPAPAPAPGRWRSGCYRPGPSAQPGEPHPRSGILPAHTGKIQGVSAPTTDELMGTLRGVIDPELGASIVELGMVQHVAATDDGAVTVKVALTIAGCPLRAQIKRD